MLPTVPAASPDPGDVESLMARILYLIVSIKLHEDEAGFQDESGREIETNLIDCIAASPKFLTDTIANVLRRPSISESLKGQSYLSECLSLSSRIEREFRHDFTFRTIKDGREKGHEFWEISLNEDLERTFVCSHVNLAHSHFVMLVEQIRRSRPNYSTDYFVKHCLTNYEAILKKEMFDLHEPARVNLVCDRVLLVEHIFRYSYSQGYRLCDLLIVPLYDVFTSAQPYLNCNNPTVLCFLYVSGMNEHTCEGDTKLMFTLMNLGRYSVIREGRFEAIIPITDIDRIKKITVYTTTITKRIEASKGEVAIDFEPEEPRKASVDDIFKSKFSFFKDRNRARNLEASELMSNIGNKRKATRVELTILCLHVQAHRAFKYTIHSPFLDEGKLSLLLTDVVKSLQHEKPYINTLTTYNDFLKRCYLHLGTNLIFI